MNDTYTIHDFEGTGDFNPCFTVSRASYRLHRPVSSFCYRAQVLKEEEGFACVKASGRVSWLFGAVALTASYEEQKPEAQILLFGASLETWKRRLKKIRRGEASVPRTEEMRQKMRRKQKNSRAERTGPDRKTAEGDSTEGAARARAGTGCAEKSILERFFGRIEYLPENC